MSNGREEIDSSSRCDDGSDDSIVSSSLAEIAVAKGIGKMTSIDKLSLAVALKKKNANSAQAFQFSRKWTVPRTILHLTSGNLALLNICLLVADDNLACENLFIGQPVLHHLRVDTYTLLDNNRFALNSSECSEAGNPTSATTKGHFNHLIKPILDQPKVNYHTARQDFDPFPDPGLLDSIGSTQHDDNRNAVDDMVKTAIDNGLEDDDTMTLRQIVDDHINIFRTSLSSGPPAQVKTLKIQLTSDAPPVRVRLRKYSQDQRNFLAKFF